MVKNAAEAAGDSGETEEGAEAERGSSKEPKIFVHLHIIIIIGQKAMLGRESHL